MNAWKRKCILVTGAGGFLGSRLVERLASAGARIVRLVRTAGAAPSDPAGRIETLLGDVREWATWLAVKERPDIVFHLAAQTSVYVAAKDPAADWRANALPMLHLLEICRLRDWRPGIVFAGSATQFGLTPQFPVSDEHPDRPVTIYDWHKVVAEGYLHDQVVAGKLAGVTLRLANVYGPGPAGTTQDRGILNQMIRRALRGETLTLYGTGAQTRDYVFSDDVVDAFLAAAEHVDRLGMGHFVIGSGEGHTLSEAFGLVAERVERIAGRRPAITSVEPTIPLSPIEARSFVANSSRFRTATGWRPRVTLREGIDLTVRAFQEATLL